MEETEQVILGIITNAGLARSYAFEALEYAKDGDFGKAEEYMKNSKIESKKSHKVQTTLIQNEANGIENQFSILLIHAQDHLMTSLLAQELIERMIDTEKELHELKGLIK